MWNVLWNPYGTVHMAWFIWNSYALVHGIHMHWSMESIWNGVFHGQSIWNPWTGVWNPPSPYGVHMESPGDCKDLIFSFFQPISLASKCEPEMVLFISFDMTPTTTSLTPNHELEVVFFGSFDTTPTTERHEGGGGARAMMRWYSYHTLPH